MFLSGKIYDFDCIDRYNVNYHDIIPYSFITHVIRFRTKSGKIAHLLIDSNIRYVSKYRKFLFENAILKILLIPDLKNPDGSFGHTRCFIRDDTARKIQEARATLLLEETSRSLANMDNFMSKVSTFLE